jgi:hypothetical protein
MSSGIETFDLTPAQEQLILALLRSKTKRTAALSAGVPLRTMYNWLANPSFQAALRTARRKVFEEAWTS